ncbi:MAG: 3'(2'),5'-bisphosphate nucleotidase CysQ [Bacteroidales bacterium]|nr:3'(2'),5'-bisphosphate nucleotidase CysQ [Bacteroidales bacterium]
MDLLGKAIRAAIEAGSAIRELYDTGEVTSWLKEDKSPVTNADLAANSIITGLLSTGYIPLLSEENKAIPYSVRKKWDEFWLIDPLDGTKEFLKRNGEFTVNIALILQNLPHMGVIYAPVTGELYFGNEDKGSCKTRVKKITEDIITLIDRAEKLPLTNENTINRIAVSRSHMNEATKNYIASRSSNTAETLLVSMGSSLKICMVAEGSATYYPRFGPTMEWDTAAGHAILRFAGKSMKRIDTGEELRYNKENLLNPDFIAE